ncbi:MAG TPA: hypothetical protein VGO22_09050 [Pseudorhizobium sp.]|jgi:hypothetical protein|nr:hypothetical protein [Pseudorhizobium sp.]
MALSLALEEMIHTSSPMHGSTARNRVPAAASFARLSINDQSIRIQKVQAEIDTLTEGLRAGTIVANHRGRGRALRDMRERQKRLDKLARAFGYRREWRKHVRIPAASGTL